MACTAALDRTVAVNGAGMVIATWLAPGIRGRSTIVFPLFLPLALRNFTLMRAFLTAVLGFVTRSASSAFRVV